MATKKHKQTRGGGGTGTAFHPLGPSKTEFLNRMQALMDAKDFVRGASLARGQASRNPLDFETQRALALCLAYTSEFATATKGFDTVRHLDARRATLDNTLFWAMMCSLVKIEPTKAVQIVEECVASKTMNAVQGYRWVRYVGQYTCNFKLVREISERFIPSWRAVFPTLPEIHHSDGTVRFPSIVSTLPLYDGGKIQGQTLVIYDGSGFGDCFFSVRWLPTIKSLSRAARVVFVIRPELQSFANSFVADAEIVEHTGREFIPDGPACFAPLVALTTIIAPDRENLWPGPYVSAPPVLVAQWRQRLNIDLPAANFRVGVAWKAGHIGVEALSWRNVEAAALASLSTVGGVSLVSLQKGHGQDEYVEIPGCLSYATEIASFEDTAAIVANLDLVITVDSGVANLAGAMGARTWVLLEPLHDGRYGLTETPDFYPTIRVFRQHVRGDWTGAVARVTEALRALAAASRRDASLG